MKWIGGGLLMGERCYLRGFLSRKRGEAGGELRFARIAEGSEGSRLNN